MTRAVGSGRGSTGSTRQIRTLHSWMQLADETRHTTPLLDSPTIKAIPYDGTRETDG